MTTLDSRLLRHTDSFAQRFSTAGRAHYSLSRGISGCELPEPELFGIDVVKPRQRGPVEDATQHDVIVRFDGSSLVADPPELTVTAGDIVLWSAADSDTPPFSLRGRSDAFSFDSRSLGIECIYSHVFSEVGNYSWTDPGGSGVSGEVRVDDIDSSKTEECERWREALEAGVVVRITGSSVEPSSTATVPYQTLFFIVLDAPGIAIVDRRLLEPAAEPV